MLDGILYQLKNGCNWEDLPKDLPPYSTVYWHYKQWRTSGATETLMQTLHEQGFPSSPIAPKRVFQTMVSCLKCWL
ncbi:transposase [Leptolyngbya sp. NK1-12]|uniref:transposase n=1 Tax=Leptolyngbya sp. NK1-12 TaxID=2547451 RepID=UPI003B63B166